MDFSQGYNVAVVGPRTYTNYHEFCRKLIFIINSYKININNLISGGCRGTDTLAKMFYREYYKKEIIEYLPNEDERKIKGDGIYYDRNLLIVKNSDIIITFVTTPISKGTKMTLDIAEKHNKYVIKIPI